nr:immunoglobulin heavy chain junction region [Mus musculus]
CARVRYYYGSLTSYAMDYW